MLQLGRLVDQSILVAEIRLDGAQIVVDFSFGVVAEEDATTGLRGQLRQVFGPEERPYLDSARKA